VTGKRLSIGHRKGWYHRPGTTFDLCHSAWESLSETEKGCFVKVEKVEDLGEELHRYQRACKKDSPKESEPTEAETSFAHFVDTISAIASDFVNVAADGSDDVQPAQPATPKPILEVEILSGPSVPAGTVVNRNAKLVAVWEVRNLAKEGIWADVRVKPVGTNPFNAPENGFEVPMLEGGSSGLVSIDLVVPTELEDGDVSGSFALVDGEGNAFGPELMLTVRVEVRVEARNEAQMAREADLVGQLMEMGLGDALACLKAVRENKGDVNAAAVSLLRATRN